MEKDRLLSSTVLLKLCQLFSLSWIFRKHREEEEEEEERLKRAGQEDTEPVCDRTRTGDMELCRLKLLFVSLTAMMMMKTPVASQQVKAVFFSFDIKAVFVSDVGQLLHPSVLSQVKLNTSHFISWTLSSCHCYFFFLLFHFRRLTITFSFRRTRSNLIINQNLRPQISLSKH